MDIIKKYGDVIRQKTETDPQKALRMFRFGFGVEYQKASKLADKQLPYGYREIYKAAVKNTREVLEEPQKECLDQYLRSGGDFSVFRSESHIP